MKVCETDEPSQDLALLEIKRRAKEAFDQEQFHDAVIEEVARLRAQANQSLWQRLLDKLPFTITIRRKQP